MKIGRAGIGPIVYAVLIVCFWTTIVAAESPREKYGKYPVTIGGIGVLSFWEGTDVPGETARGEIPYFDSQSYFLGVIDTYRLLAKELPREKQACIPEDFTMNKFIDFMVKSNKSSQYTEKDKASEAILKIVLEKFKCNGSDN